MKSISRIVWLSITCAVLVVPSHGFAGEPPKSTKTSLAPEQAGSDWAVTLGGLGLFKPKYEGSSDYEVTGFPNIDVKWRDRVFLNGRDGIGVNIWNDRMFTLSTSVGYTFGRDEDDSNDLSGLGDIDGGAVAIVKGRLRHKGMSLSTSFRHQLTGDDTGFLIDVGLGYFWRPQDNWFFKPGLSASFANGEYMDRYFGISAGQSANSGFAAYDADAGFKTVGASLLSGYSFTQHWSLTGRLSYDRLVGDAANSPITKDKNQFKVGIGLSWRM